MAAQNKGCLPPMAKSKRPLAAAGREGSQAGFPKCGHTWMYLPVSGGAVNVTISQLASGSGTPDKVLESKKAGAVSHPGCHPDK